MIKPVITLLAKVDERKAILAGGLLACLPLVLFHRLLGQFFWFGDDLDQLDQIQRVGFWSWSCQVFAENFVPLFKLLWGSCVYLFHGSYFGMLAVLWLTHIVNTVQLGRLLRQYGFPLGTILTCQAVFGLTASNMETLGWSTQWSAVLATSFLLFGLDWVQKVAPSGSSSTSRNIRWQTIATITLLSAGSALSFSRGVITGGLLALACFWPTTVPYPMGRRWLHATLFVFPAIVTAGLITVFATGNHQHLHGHALEAADYSVWYFCMNPFYSLIEMDSWGSRTVFILGTLKVAVIALGFLRANPCQRKLLALLLIFDLVNAALLGIGRYHTGLGTSTSSRYQYGSLIAVLPFAALCIEDVLRRLAAVRWHASTAIACLLIVVSSVLLRRWPGEINGFARSRGSETRDLLFQSQTPPENGAVPGIPFLSTARAKELARIYNLH